MELGIEGKRAVVIGGSSGLGLAVAQRLAREGANSCSSPETRIVFARYNLTLWPAPIVLNALAVLAVLLVYRGRPSDGRWVPSVYQDLGLLVAAALALVLLFREREGEAARPRASKAD